MTSNVWNSVRIVLQHWYFTHTVKHEDVAVYARFS